MQFPSGPLPSMPGDIPDGDSTIDLPTTGATRYMLMRAPTGRSPSSLCVMIHGISYPMDVYRGLATRLVADGYDALFYDVTGRGWSASSGAPLTIDHYVAQLTELLAALGLDSTPQVVFGWSMGSLIASRYARSYPSRVRKLVLIGPVGARTPVKPLTASLLHIPFGIGNALGALAVPGTLRKLYRAELGGVAGMESMLDFLCDHAARNKALVRTLISTLRSCPEIDDDREGWRRVGASGIPVLVVWGDKDGTVSRQAITDLLELLGPSGARLAEFGGLGHSCFVTHPDAVAKEVLAFL